MIARYELKRTIYVQFSCILTTSKTGIYQILFKTIEELQIEYQTRSQSASQIAVHLRVIEPCLSSKSKQRLISLESLGHKFRSARKQR